MDPYSRAKKNTRHGKEVLTQDTTHLIQRPCYQRGSPCQDPAGSWTTRRPPDDRKETQTAEVWSCLPFIKSGQNHLARQGERRKKIRKTEEEVGRRHQEMGRPGVRQVPEGNGEQEKMEKSSCESICGAPTTFTVKEWMMLLMMMIVTIIAATYKILTAFFVASTAVWETREVRTAVCCTLTRPTRLRFCEPKDTPIGL